MEVRREAGLEMGIGREQRQAARGERARHHPGRAADRGARQARGVSQCRDAAAVGRRARLARAGRCWRGGRLVHGGLRLGPDGVAADAAREEGPRRCGAQLAHELLEHDHLVEAAAVAPRHQLHERERVRRRPGIGGADRLEQRERRALFARADPRQPRVHAGRVGLEHTPAECALAQSISACETGEVERARFAIAREALFADQLGGAPAGDAAQPEHLGQTILRMREAEREPGVVLARGAHVGNAAAIAHDRDGRLDARHHQRAFERRMRRAQRTAPFGPAQQADHRHRHQRDAGDETHPRARARRRDPRLARVPQPAPPLVQVIGRTPPPSEPSRAGSEGGRYTLAARGAGPAPGLERPQKEIGTWRWQSVSTASGASDALRSAAWPTRTSRSSASTTSWSRRSSPTSSSGTRSTASSPARSPRRRTRSW